MSGAHFCLRKNCGEKYAWTRARSRHWHLSREAPGITAFPHSRATRSRAGLERREASRETNGLRDTRERTDEPREAPGRDRVTADRTRKHHVKYRMPNRAVYEIRERLAGCAHHRAIHSAPFIAFCLKLGTLWSERVPWYSIHRDCRFIYSATFIYRV